MFGTKALQRTHLDAHQVGVEHTHQDVRRIGRVGQRAQDVEDGAHTEFLAHGRHVLHRGVVVRREHEADAGVGDAAADGWCSRGSIGMPSTQFEHVGAARLAGLTRCARRAWPTRAPAGRGHEHRGRWRC